MKTRISADGWLDISDRKRVRMPGMAAREIDPAPEAEALAFLLSHSFPGHRKIVRPMSVSDRKKIQLALWADSVGERMNYVDRVWRNITDAVPAPKNGKPELLQVVRYGTAWAYPLYLDGQVTRVLPHGGVSMAEHQAGPEVQMELAAAR
jgi:hypothetical protein